MLCVGRGDLAKIRIKSCICKSESLKAAFETGYLVQNKCLNLSACCGIHKGYFVVKMLISKL
jgi:hypothetical protein